MNRKAYCELMNALENISRKNESIIEDVCIQTRNRLFVVRRKDITSMENGILINTGDEVIAMPYSSIEYIST